MNVPLFRTSTHRSLPQPLEFNSKIVENLSEQSRRADNDVDLTTTLKRSADEPTGQAKRPKV